MTPPRMQVSVKRFRELYVQAPFSTEYRHEPGDYLPLRGDTLEFVIDAVLVRFSVQNATLTELVDGTFRLDVTLMRFPTAA